MADHIALKVSYDGISKHFKKMIDRSELTSGWLNRVAYPLIIQAQRMRWASEGASEGDSWEPLNQSYAMRKLKRYANYPGAGRKMLIATGRLVAGVTGENRSDHYKLVKNGSLKMGTTIPYAEYVNEARNFTDLGDRTTKDLAKRFSQYIAKG